MSDDRVRLTVHLSDEVLERLAAIEEKEEAMTLGEERVRVKFNPSDNSLVSQIKQKTAELITICAAMADKTDDPEIGRSLSLAMTRYEEAAMWAVKAATA